MHAREYHNEGDRPSPRFRTLRSAWSHFKFHFPSDSPLDAYIRARRAFVGERDIPGNWLVLRGQAPGRASHARRYPALPEVL